MGVIINISVSVFYNLMIFMAEDKNWNETTKN